MSRAPIEYAAAFARFGRVLPLREASKIPAIADWVNAASSDPAQVARWAEEFPGANLGWAMGNGLIAIDVDAKSGGLETLADLERTHGPLPVTFEQTTPSGGKHYVFRYTGNASNTVGRLPGIDVRTSGGQIVIAPSVVAGKRYAWIRGRAPWDLDQPAELPQWLADALLQRPALEAAIEPDAVFPPATPDDLDHARSALERFGPAIEGQSGDSHTFIACAIVRNDYALTEGEAWPLIEAWNETCRPPWDAYELAEKFRSALKYAKGPRGAKRKTDDRPSIQLQAGKLAEIASAAEAALIGVGVDVYSRGGTLVRPVVEEVDAAHGRRTNVARLRALEPTYLRDLLSRTIQFKRWDARRKAYVAADPPPDVANVILGRDGEWRFPSVAGVVTTPTLRPDGTILSKPGYDAQTRLLLVNPQPIPPIDLSFEGASESLARLEGLLSEFPFVNAESQSVVISAILTTIARGAFEVAPGHAASASTAGTGKSFLWDVVAAIAIGQRCPVITAPRDDAELEKRLGAAMLSGQPILSIDNMTVALGGDQLCQLIERPVVNVRILGRSELARIESRATVFATGNNIAISGDATRRVLLARLEANVERPELREFSGNPFDTVLANRGRYVADALTVVAAYAAAGRPQRSPRLASFEGWSDTVRSALNWLGRADPVATMESARADDPELARLRAVLATWSQRLGLGKANAHTAAEVLRLAEAAFGDEFNEAVLAVANNHGRSDARTLGKWLSRNKDRIVDGVRLKGESSHGHSAKWWIDAVGAVPAVRS